MAAGAELHLPEYREEERENERQDGNREMGRRLWAAIRNLCSKKGVIFIGNSFVNVCVLVRARECMCVCMVSSMFG